MLKEIKDREYEESVWYELCFDDGHNNGFGFPCDENGEIHDDLTDAAKENYKWALQHPEKFFRFNKVVEHKRSWLGPRKGLCECGEWVDLINEYMGACECPNCGKWYSLSGQELLPPDEWGWDGTPIDDDY